MSDKFEADETTNLKNENLAKSEDPALTSSIKNVRSWADF
jgi:hypothetical protein